MEYVKATRPNGDVYKVPTPSMYDLSSLVDMLNVMAEDSSNFTIENCIKNAQKQPDAELTTETENKGTNMTKPHKHKDLIVAWANGETIQYWNDELQSWRNCSHPDFNFDCKLRVKPKIILINGIEVPAPEQQALDIGTLYYTPSMWSDYQYRRWLWTNDGEDKRSLSRGLVHLTKEAAEQHTKALLSFTSK